jgi:hypothetical protein
MTSESSSTTTALTGIAAILQAIAWPALIAVMAWIYRARVNEVMDILREKLKQANKGKIGPVEFESAMKEISQVVDQTGREAGSHESGKEIPKTQVQAAQLVQVKLHEAPIAFSQKLDVVHSQVYELVDEYERIRRTMKPGPQRTHSMNEISAKLRALSIVAYPLLPSLMQGEMPGERLAAICILQVKPDLSIFDWLIERVMKEKQAFLLFHASLAVLELVKSHPYLSSERAARSIRSAIDHVKSFQDGTPDQNTIDVLNEALTQLNAASAK